ncbi:5-(carboxyamino)imidazole ribonucleotide mutase [Candidatus Micrarchaeota archaeon CG08_land_8_20_14_0_20_49_17]|nr:MAG: 5-(carboxyamino)imidazole ribonucleotide mutase [Candidatus Micrarchaeota archaeon CG1_02_49_24]PIU09284.1 MAG: 5-(carboxyamino)imidazole ribonucleotide mutase [Candidatus Micrarchaeota archaeon CG08_land_8_20_14_0_20_49_17]PIU81600.1 MAG: 5-(carboxyamino)imidazole ribonucleotide mutase [Candidatus Micrarchaeota archaeon CG06_land_8_20_14_3_00_50_6]PIZ98498.1 MAG: 5-(carboxyamino)imidazole ribonucleotide mutase [Candidatus Micrarchaeota archaeon CG_4_10_14_0_2_um_filter_49_7]HII53567.1 
MIDIDIVVGSESDLKSAEIAKSTLGEFKVSSRITVASAHRTPEKVESLIASSDAKVFIAIAGLSAALPGVVASKTTKPVIGVPVNVKLGGIDALLSCMQMPTGIPVAAVGVDNAENAAILAVEILALSNKSLANALIDYREKLKQK